MNGKETLQDLISKGIVWKDGREYIGKASDGEEVTLGDDGNLDSLYRYLASNPSPCDW